jgi:tetratricopeptide (TPR) repeat protein
LGAKDESVVIGRLVLDPVKQPLPFFANLIRMGLVVTNEATQIDYTLVCDGTALDSEFFVSLPPGQYRFLHVRDSRVGWVKTASGDWVPGGPSSGTFTLNWLLPFRIPYPRFEVRAGEVQYLGTIRFLGAGRDSSLLGGGSWLIEDESAKTIKSFRERYPRITQTVVMAAMLEGSRRVEPSNAALYFDRGYAHEDKGQYDQAISYLTKALEYDPRHVRAYTERGYAYDRKGQYDQAISDHTKALEINPRYANAYNNRGYAYFQKGQYDQAISDLTEALKLEPRYAAAYLNLGNVYARKGQYDQAISDFTKALEINPRYGWAYNNRGTTFVDKGQYDQAISDFTKALEIDPSSATTYGNRGEAYFRKGQYDQAISDLTKALETNPRDAEPLYNYRARSYYSLREFDKAWGDVRKAQESGANIDPTFLKDLREASGREK